MRRLALVLAIAACGHHHTAPPAAAPPPAADDGPRYDPSHLPRGLDVRLSDGAQGPAARDHTPVQGTPIADVGPLFAGMKPLATDAPAAFSLRPGSLPPPRPGATISASFAGQGSAAPVINAGGELRVLRHAPEGEVPIAGQLSITFSQPMVALTSQTDAAATRPAKLTRVGGPPTPEPKGTWRWIGTRTLVFDADPRFAQASTYRVEIPAGTKSVTGGVLASTVAFSFQTPPVVLQSYWPDQTTEPQHPDTPMLAWFDQRVDPATALSSVLVRANGAAVRVRPLSPAELAALPDALRERTAKADGRWIAFRAADPLPRDAKVTVAFQAGMASAEGPRTTVLAQGFSFRTFGPFRLQTQSCATGCPPNAWLGLVLTNPIDPAHFDEHLVTVTPAIPKLHVVGSGRSIEVTGELHARTHYHVHVARALTDELGDPLDKDIDATFAIGDPEPMLIGPQGLVTLDPARGAPALDVYSTNVAQLEVRLYRVAPADYAAFETFVANRWNRVHPPAPPGALVRQERVTVHADPTELAMTPIDLAPALTDGRGDVVAIVTPATWPKDRGTPPQYVAWAQATHIGLDAHADGDKLLAYASELATGKALGGVDLAYGPGEAVRTTDASGLATLPLPGDGSRMLIASAGGEHAFVVSWYGRWGVANAPSLAWYVADDRQLYRPGETVALKGWLRTLGRDVEPMDPSITSIAYRVMDASGNEIGKGTAKLGRLGGFSTAFALPATPATGDARVLLTAGASSFEHDFRIEEIRRPEFEVSAHAGEGPYIVAGSGADVTATASYYAGGPLAGAPVTWNVAANQTTFTPPNRDDYTFGAWPHDDDDDAQRAKALPASWTHAGTTDATGTSVLHLAFATVEPAAPMSVIAEATVHDTNHQAWATQTALIVHPSAAYVGLKAKAAFVAQGTPFELGVIGVGIDGKPLHGAKIDLRAVRLDWEFKDGRYRTKELDPQTCEVTAADAEQRCHFATPTGGTYRVLATITDERGRPNHTELTYWVTGGGVDPTRAGVTLIPDRTEYTVGQTAHVLVAPPFAPAEGLVTWRRNGIVKAERVTFTAASQVIDVPITDELVPNLYVQVDVVGRAPGVDAHGAPDPKAPTRMAHATGAADLSIPPKTRTLAVTITPAAPAATPGTTTSLAVRVVDAAGHPVSGADVAVMAVDESVLALAGYTHPNPLDTFYAQRPPGVEDISSRVLGEPAVTGQTIAVSGYEVDGDFDGLPDQEDGVVMGKLEANTRIRTVDEPPPPPAAPAPVTEATTTAPSAHAEAGPMGGEVAKNAGRGPAAPALRTNFDALAVFAPEVTTAADGTARVAVKLPDNLTRYRLVAIAAAGTAQFGKGEGTLTARLPLMVRPSAPRFLGFGDSFRLPVSVQNQTNAPLTVRIGVRATNLAITSGAGRQVTVPANDRVLVEIPMAAEHPGTAHLQVVATSGTYSDAAELALPVRTPATTETFATYGVIDDGAAALPVALPKQIVPDFGGVEVSAASTNMASLTDALLYLVHYPYECAEQRASRIAAIAALRDEIAAFHAQDLPSSGALDASMADDLEHLVNMQTYDGGFVYWTTDEPSDPYLTIFVVDALARARAKGLHVPDALIARAHPYLVNIEAHIDPRWDLATRTALSAYALAARAELGDRDLAKAARVLAAAGDRLPVEAAGHLLQVFGDAPGTAAERAQLVRFAENHAVETAGAANFATGYSDDGAHLLLASDRRADAVMLDGLIAAEPASDLIPKIVQGLLAHRTKGHWDNTQEDAFVLLALDRYFRTYEKIEPDFVARVWLGDGYAGDHTFAGRTAETYAVAIPMSEVARRDGSALAIAKDGAGRLYYRIAMTYAPAATVLAPADDGFAVARRYEAVDDPHDVTRDAAGTWHVKAGARVRVHVTMVNDDRRYQVALVDPLPAGLEPLNQSLNGTGSVPTEAATPWWDRWYEHENVRDDRVEAFARLLGEGVHEYTYVARATTPGDFAVAPPKAEEMYSPETFGRGASDRVVVE